MKRQLVIWVALTVVLGSCAKQNIAPTELNQNNSGIIGGTPALDTDAVRASTVSLLTTYDNKPFSFCTGTLISKNLILTATHCLKYAQKETSFVFIGAKLPKTFEGARTFAIENWITNPSYKEVTDKNGSFITGLNDVALIRLKEDAPADATPVPVLDESISLKDGQSLLLAGYGLLSELNVPVYADGLYYTHVSLAKTAWDSILVTDQTGNQGACAGDSGGPAYLETGKGFIVVGITRGPHERAQDCRHYGEYTFAAKFKTFILNSAAQLKAEAPQFVIPDAR